MTYLNEDQALAFCSAIGAALISMGYTQYGGLAIAAGGFLKAVWPTAENTGTAPATPPQETRA